RGVASRFATERAVLVESASIGGRLRALAFLRERFREVLAGVLKERHREAQTRTGGRRRRAEQLAGERFGALRVAARTGVGGDVRRGDAPRGAAGLEIREGELA